jgi:hypothetical protein
MREEREISPRFCPFLRCFAALRGYGRLRHGITFRYSSVRWRHQRPPAATHWVCQSASYRRTLITNTAKTRIGWVAEWTKAAVLKTAVRETVMFKKRARVAGVAGLEWTAAIAFFCALLAGANGSSSWTWTFANLPANDSLLRSWLESQNRSDVVVSRDGNSVTLLSATGVLAGIRNNVPQVPWPQLGYVSMQKMSGSTKWSLFSGSPYLWLAGFGVLMALGIFRRRYINRTQKIKSVENAPAS